MRRSRRVTKKTAFIEDSSDDDDDVEMKNGEFASSNRKKPKLSVTNNDESSSSESDIENYLQPVDKIDLNSSFFNLENTDQSQSFDAVEKTIFADINRLSDSSDSDDTKNAEQNEKISTEAIALSVNFQQLHNYTKKLEETRNQVAQYESKRKAREKKRRKQASVSEDTLNILDLLAAGESKNNESQNASKSFSSDDFESESEKEDWEEVNHQEKKETEESIVPKDGVQITVELPTVMRKKKGVDLIASMKRRLNRVKKENQIYVHMVHLLCWIAHGNCVNKVLNSEEILAMALSLLPSQHCYPSNRVDLNYLEQIVKWYTKTIINKEKSTPEGFSLESLLTLQLTKKEAYNKKMLVYIFICIMRALGIQCRLVLSFQVLPLRPPASELCSLSTKSPEKGKKPKSNPDETVEKLPKTEKTNQEVKTIKAGKKPAQKNKTQDAKKSNDSKTKLAIKNDGSAGKNKTQDAKKSKDSKTKPTHKSDGSAGKNKAQDAKKSKDSKTKPTIKTDGSAGKKNAKSDVSSNSRRKENVTRSSANVKLENKNLLKEKTEAKSKRSTKIRQLDGTHDSDEADSSDYSLKTSNRNTKKTTKSKLAKLHQDNPETCSKKTHSRRLRSLPSYREADSEDDFDTNNSLAKRSKDSIRSSSTSSKNSKTITKNVKGKLSLGTKTDRNDNKTKASRSVGKNTPNKLDVRNDIIDIVKGRIAQQKEQDQQKMVKSRKSKRYEDSDSDYAPEPVNAKKRDSDDEFKEKSPIKVKQRIKVKKVNNKLVVISDDEGPQKKKGFDVWLEVFLEAEEKWISVDIIKGQVHCVNELYSRASHPVTYIVAWNNNNAVKDITQRYCPNWNTVTRKQRIDQKWWDASLKPYKGPNDIRDKEENEELARVQLEQPLPKTISEYKNHPLYALKRHLLKFQALYPPDVVTMGFIRNEAVYPRECVHTLHSRDIWLKHAKVVKPGEQPYKIVKARPKYDKLSGNMITDLPLEIFGPWQVDDYVPPTAENGIVPRNAYGNVELFKECMLPKGTVHLQLTGLNKLARKMNIDCAPAMVGFDNNSGWSFPVFDGYVVCEEHEESLIAAWHIEQEEQEKRAQEKMEKRVYGNWKRLIKGLLIRERLKHKYDFKAPSQTSEKGKKKSKPLKVSPKKRKICSDSESD